MNVLVVNYSGNVGKSTISNYCLSENLPDHNLLLVETINSTPEYFGEKISAQDFSKIFEGMFESEVGTIVDVGSSNAESFMLKMSNEWLGSHDFFKYFIIPFTPFVKQQEDADEIIRMLVGLGIDASRIKLIFNMVDPRKDLNLQFETLKAKQTIELLGLSNINEIPRVNYFDFFNTIAQSGIPFEFVRNDQRNHQVEIMKVMKSPKLNADEKKVELAKLRIHTLVKQGYNGYAKNLNEVFESLDLQPDIIYDDSNDAVIENAGENTEPAPKAKKK